MASKKQQAVAYFRTSSAANVGTARTVSAGNARP
jgi:hypothetical protein